MLSHNCEIAHQGGTIAGNTRKAIASLGLYTVLQNVISMLWGDDTKSVRTGEIKVGHEFFGAYITDIQIITIVVCVALFAACVLLMKQSRIGRNIRAVASNPELSNVVGINSNRVILWAFGIGSALAAVAGILIAFDTDMRPTMGFNWLLYGVVAMIIGGVGAYTAALLAVNFQVPFLLALPVAMLLSGLLALIVSAIALRTIDDYFIICTLGIQVVVFSLMNNWMSLTRLFTAEY